MEVTDRNQSQRSVLADISEFESGGFNFDLYHRNQTMLGQSSKSVFPSAWKTGTTICGIIYKDGVVLGADTRATGGSEVVDKNCEKIHYLAPNIYCCGAGTAADTEKTTELIASQLELLRMSTGMPSRVAAALTQTKRLLFKYQGHVSAALVLGGVDILGPQLFSIHPEGSTQKLPYATMGSGSLAAMAVFESRFREDMDESAAIQLVRDAIRAGIFNDLGSGSNVDVTVIRKDNTTSQFRTYERAAGSSDTYKQQFPTPSRLNLPKNTTLIIEETFKPFKTGNNPSSVPTSEAMLVDA